MTSSVSSFHFNKEASWSDVDTKSSACWELRANPEYFFINASPVLVSRLNKKETSMVWLSVLSLFLQCMLRYGDGYVLGTHRESNFRGMTHTMIERHFMWTILDLINCAILLFVMLHHTNKQLLRTQLFTFETFVIVGYYLAWYVTRAIGESCVFSGHLSRFNHFQTVIEIVFNTPLLVLAACLDSVAMPKRVKCAVIVLMIGERILQYHRHRSTHGIFSDHGTCMIGAVEFDAQVFHRINLDANSTIIIFLLKSLLAYLKGDHFAVIRPRFKLGHVGSEPGIGRSLSLTDVQEATRKSLIVSLPSLPEPAALESTYDAQELAAPHVPAPSPLPDLVAEQAHCETGGLPQSGCVVSCEGAAQADDSLPGSAWSATTPSCIVDGAIFSVPPKYSEVGIQTRSLSAGSCDAAVQTSGAPSHPAFSDMQPHRIEDLAQPRGFRDASVELPSLDLGSEIPAPPAEHWPRVTTPGGPARTRPALDGGSEIPAPPAEQWPRERPRATTPGTTPCRSGATTPEGPARPRATTPGGPARPRPRGAVEAYRHDAQLEPSRFARAQARPRTRTAEEAYRHDMAILETQLRFLAAQASTRSGDPRAALIGAPYEHTSHRRAPRTTMRSTACGGRG